MLTLLDISLHNSCNFHCRYCISNAVHSDGENFGEKCVHQTIGKSLKPVNLLNFIKNHFLPEDCWIQFTGGEPLIYDSLPFIVDILTQKCYRVIINTNGSLLNTLSKSVDVWRWNVRWRISWHRDMRDMKSFQKDIEPLFTDNSKPKTLVNYIATPWRIKDKSIELDLKDLKDSGLNYEITGYQGKWEGEKYDKHSLLYRQWLTAFSQEKTKACEINYLTITTTGDVMRCRKAKVGNIYEGVLKERYPQEHFICQYDNCNTFCPLHQVVLLFEAKDE